MADSNANIYGTLDLFKAQHPKPFLIRISNLDDNQEPQDFTAELDANMTKALEDASDLMDGYIMSKHPTPVADPPDFFEHDCYVLAIMILIRRRGYEKETPDAQAVEDGKEIEKKYQRLSEGKWDFVNPDSGGETAPPVRIKSEAPEKYFSKENLDMMP